MNCAEARCPTIPPRSPGCNGPFHCSACHQTFGALVMFDAHQDRPAGWGNPVTCSTPESLDLIADHHGAWQTARGLQYRRRLALAAAERRRAG